MAAFCLPPKLAGDFLAALQDGRLDPEKLTAMSSADRRAEFAKHVGEDFAKEVNSQFEAKLLLKDQQAGLVRWAQKTAGLTEVARKDILASINKMDRILQPEDEGAFLEDLAAKKLGISVSADEAKEVFQLAQRAESVRQQIVDSGKGDYAKGWTPESGDVYGRAYLALRDRLDELKPEGDSIRNKLLSVLSLPREAQTSILHWSAPFVQGWGMISTKQWWTGVGRMFQYFASEDNYRGLEAYIYAHPDYALARDGKLGLTNLGDKLTTREEGIQTHLLADGNQWLTEQTGVPNLIRGWQRSFTGFLNYVRFNRFTQLLDAARLVGEDVSPGSKTVSDLASVVNNFTGRGALGEGDKYASASPLLNAAFYAPRKMVATIEMFNPAMYAKLSPTARTAAIRQLVGSLVATGAVLTLAKIGGAQVNMDPRSSDFAKIDIGGEKLDMTGGNASYLRFMSRMVTGQYETRSGKMLDLDNASAHGMTRRDVFVNYLIGKLSPVASVLASGLYGREPTGRAFNLSDTAYNSLTPIVIKSFIDFGMNNPTDTAAILPALSAFLGVGLESPLPPMSESGRDVWGDKLPPMGTPANWRNDPVNQEFAKLGYTPSMPPTAIRGVKLNDAQLDDFARTSGRLAHMRLSQLVTSPGWNAIPSATRLSVMKGVIRTTRESAATAVMLQSQGTSNDILKQATQAKMAAATAP